MLSQYSWWDLTKTILVALFVYYAYVLWTYYREDIREWINNRGRKSNLQPEAVGATEEEDTESLYTVSQYIPVARQESAPATTAQTSSSGPVAAPSIPAPVATSENNQPVPDPDDPELSLSGPVLSEDNNTESNFSLTINANYERPQEQRLADVLSAAGRLQTNDDGSFVASDPADKKAQNLAQALNQQQGRGALAGFPFTR